MTLNVFGKKIKVLKQKGLLENGYRALFIPEQYLITIDESLVGNDFYETILHELVHAVIRRTGIDQSRIPDGVEEIICENVAVAIMENFKIRPL